MLDAYRLGIKVDYGSFSEWLNRQKPRKVIEDAKIAVKYFSGAD